jgi:DNA-directed RNA polymerase specialized sigma24 family protein
VNIEQERVFNFMKWTKFEKSFITRLRKKEEKAFTILYEKTSLQLYNYIIKQVYYNEEIAEEVLVNVFSDAISYAFSLTPLHNVEAWLFRIAKCKLADYFRQSARDRKLRIATPVDIVPNYKGSGMKSNSS